MYGTLEGSRSHFRGAYLEVCTQVRKGWGSWASPPEPERLVGHMPAKPSPLPCCSAPAPQERGWQWWPRCGEGTVSVANVVKRNLAKSPKSSHRRDSRARHLREPRVLPAWGINSGTQALFSQTDVAKERSALSASFTAPWRRVTCLHQGHTHRIILLSWSQETNMAETCHSPLFQSEAGEGGRSCSSNLVTEGMGNGILAVATLMFNIDG